jgi:hypothetical protein
MVSQAVSHTQWQLFWLAATGCALGGSWLANALWYAAARRLPPTLSGQLIVFETLFALLYGFAWLQRWPRPLELASMLLLLLGGWPGRYGGMPLRRTNRQPKWPCKAASLLTGTGHKKRCRWQRSDLTVLMRLHWTRQSRAFRLST